MIHLSNIIDVNDSPISWQERVTLLVLGLRVKGLGPLGQHVPLTVEGDEATIEQ